MIPNAFSDIAPKAAVAAALLWAGANFLLIGPEVGSRIARADHLPVCEANISAMIAQAGKARLSAVPQPQVDAEQQMASEGLRMLRDDPMMQQLRVLGGGVDFFGMDRMADFAKAKADEASRAARTAYEETVARIEQETATELGKAGSLCGCLADAAIASTRTEWAIFSGSLGLIRPAPLKDFYARMEDAQRSGACVKGGA